MKLILMSAHARAPNISASQVADDTNLSFMYTRFFSIKIERRHGVLYIS